MKHTNVSEQLLCSLEIGSFHGCNETNVSKLFGGPRRIRAWNGTQLISLLLGWIKSRSCPLEDADPSLIWPVVAVYEVPDLLSSVCGKFWRKSHKVLSCYQDVVAGDNKICSFQTWSESCLLRSQGTLVWFHLQWSSQHLELYLLEIKYVNLLIFLSGRNHRIYLDPVLKLKLVFMTDGSVE